MILEYYTDVSATIPLINPEAVSFSGIYYIKAINPLSGCSVLKPVQVIVGNQATLSAISHDACSGNMGSIEFEFTNVPDGVYDILYTGGKFTNVPVKGGKTTILAPAGIYNKLNLFINGNSTGNYISVIIKTILTPESPISIGDRIECEMFPTQTLNANDEIVPVAGNTIRWYDSPRGGNLISSPILNAVGITTFYAEAYNGNCSSSGRTPVTLTIIPSPETPLITQIGDILYSNSISGNQWFNQEGIIIGATNQNYVPKAIGDYYVVVNSNYCRSSPSNTISFIPTVINSIAFRKVIKVYPNPLNDELTIEIEGNAINTNFEILNSIGQTVYKGSLTGKTVVQTNSFTPGIYLIKLKTGASFEFRKIIKQ